MASIETGGARKVADSEGPMTNHDVKQILKNARLKFAAMGGAYFLGVFNDNFFKQSAILLALATALSSGKDKPSFAGLPSEMVLNVVAATMFALPFILFAAPAGWMADRFPKRRIVIAAKLLELVAAILGAVGVLTMSWLLIIMMLFTMALQSAIFNPALNGSIPELYPDEHVPKANSIIRLVSTCAILAGAASAGPALDAKGFYGKTPVSRLIIAGVIVVVAVAGLIVSLGVPSRKAADVRARFPSGWLADTFRELGKIKRDPQLGIAVLADAFIWFIASLQLLFINALGVLEFHFSNTRTSGLIVAQMLGVAAGSLLAGRLVTPARWHRTLLPALLAMCGIMPLAALSPAFPDAARTILLIAIFAGVGAAGGLLLIPLESFIQIRPPANRKGTVIAAANFAAFVGIFFSGPVFGLLYSALGCTPSRSFAAIGVAAAVFYFWLKGALKRSVGGTK